MKYSLNLLLKNYFIFTLDGQPRDYIPADLAIVLDISSSMVNIKYFLK